MPRKKNTVTITRANASGTQYEIWFDGVDGRTRIRKSSAEILKAVQHYKICPSQLRKTRG